METFKENNMTNIELEKIVITLQSELSETREVLARISQAQQDSTQLMGTLNRDVSEVKLSMKELQRWARDMNNSKR